MSNLLSELEAVVGRVEQARSAESEIIANQEAADFLRTHHAEIAAAVRDAARYRWLRDASTRDWCITRDNPRGGMFQLVGPVIDAEIDKHIAAMSAREGE